MVGLIFRKGRAAVKPSALPVARAETEQEQVMPAKHSTPDLYTLRRILNNSDHLQRNDIMAVQQAYGNQAVLRLLADRGQTGGTLQRHAGHDDQESSEAMARQVQRNDSGNPVAPSDKGSGGEHPVLRQGTGAQNKIAVQELQQKLNSVAAADPPLVVDGIFGQLTLKAVKNFQSSNTVDIKGKKEPLVADGVVGPKTWTALDVNGSSNVGQIRNTWTEADVGGETYGLTSSYSWKITDTAVEVAVKFHFSGGGKQRQTIIDNAFKGITNTWNTFKIAKEGSSTALDLKFNPTEAPAGTDVSTVKLIAKDGRSDAGTWFLEDPDLNTKTAPHEFGHMLGLEDEYQRSHTDYKRLTGDVPPTGTPTTPAQIAQAPAIAASLHAALRTPGGIRKRAKAAFENVIKANNLTPGVLTHTHIMPSYVTQFGVGVTQDIHNQLGDEASAGLPVSLSNGTTPNVDEVRFRTVEPFTFTSTSLMGDMSTVVPNSANSHEHGLEPRHVRQFTGAVQKLKGGKWKAVFK